jgi:hypothetical protein
MTGESSDPKNPLESLTPEQRSRIDKLAASISFDKICVSFSIEDRDAGGRKKSCFFSVTASRGGDAEAGEASPGYTPEEAKIVRTLLSKHVVAGTYDDAMRRMVIPGSVGKEECRAILHSYDRALVQLLGKPQINGDIK